MVSFQYFSLAVLQLLVICGVVICVTSEVELSKYLFKSDKAYHKSIAVIST